MKISHALMQQAVKQNIINQSQADALIDLIKQQPEQTPRFNLTNVLYYFGGLIAIGAMTLFMNLSWEHYGGFGIFGVSLLYAVLGLCFTTIFQRKSLPIPAGICATFVVALTPLAIYGLQKGLGFWPDDASVYQNYHAFISWQWIYMELGTLAVGVILAFIYRYPFMIMPIAVTLWYMSMDVAALVTSQYPDFEFRATLSMYFGLVITLIALWVDIRSRNSADFAFWLYLFGVIAFWGGLTAQSSDSELSKFFYLCINLLLIAVGVILSRKVFVIFGGLGCACYFGHLAFAVFQNSLMFPFALTVIGLLVIYLGTLWQKHEACLTKSLRSHLPVPLQELLEAREE